MIPRARARGVHRAGIVREGLSPRVTTPRPTASHRPNRVRRRHTATTSSARRRAEPPRYWTGAPDAPGGYIAASYVKWLEAAGARAVPILYTDSNETIHGKLSAVNGVLLPGGDSDISPGTSLRAAGESVVRESMAAAAGRCISGVGHLHGLPTGGAGGGATQHDFDVRPGGHDVQAAAHQGGEIVEDAARRFAPTCWRT